MALSSILSLGLHLTIFLLFYYGLPFSKINDRKETIIPLIFEESIQIVHLQKLEVITLEKLVSLKELIIRHSSRELILPR